MTDDPERDTARRLAAAQWHAELHDPDIDPETWQAFLAWEAADPANAAAYGEIQQAMERLDPSSLATRQMGEDRPRRAALFLAGTALAAALIVTLLVSAMASPAALPLKETYLTEIGGQESVRLADGSQVHLNTDTEVEIAYSDSVRRIHLVRGQALFDVARETRPFIVTAGETETIARGTQFDIYHQGEQVRIALVEGRVSVAAAGRGTTELLPGQQALVMAGQGLDVSPADLDALAQWRTGQVEFDNVTLADAIAEMNRYSATKIEITDPALASERISGIFPAGAQEAFAEALTLYLDAGLDHAPGRIRVIPARADAGADGARPE